MEEIIDYLESQHIHAKEYHDYLVKEYEFGNTKYLPDETVLENIEVNKLNYEKFERWVGMLKIN